jgi:hypothetical protein
MKTVTELLEDRADALRRLLEELLDRASVSSRNLRPGGDMVIITGRHFAWGSLDEEGRRVQSRALRKYEP